MIFWLQLFVFFCACSAVIAGGDVPINSVTMKVQNDAGAPIELYWKNTFSPGNELVKQSTTPIRNNTHTIINSYDGHVFVVKLFNNSVAGPAEWAKMATPEVVVITLDENTGDLRAEQRTKLDDMHDMVSEALQACRDKETGEVDSHCVADDVLGEFIRLETSKEQLTKLRDKMSVRLRNYTCADPKMETSPPLHSQAIKIEGRSMQMNDLYEDPHAKIWTVEEFMTQDECDLLLKHGKPRLTRATVAAEDGTSILSNSRKANQASYDVISDTDPLKPLYDRVLYVANGKNGMDLRPEGQESFTIIQYDPNDEYYPHCDGSCDNTKHKDGGRVATAVMYCVVPEVGGATTFTKADVFVKPLPRMATFFTYYNPEDGLTDDGYTEHSGCPVLKGDKWIATVWMRRGVTRERPWELYDPSGVEIMDFKAHAERKDMEVQGADGRDEL